MSAQPKTYLAPAEYLAFERASARKHELCDKVGSVPGGHQTDETPNGS